MSTGSEEEKCNLVGWLGLASQIGMGFLLLCTMLVKRHLENPRRQWRVFFLDVSKQVLSSLVLHFVNLHLAITADKTSSDQCSRYHPFTQLLVNDDGGCDPRRLRLLDSLDVPQLDV